MKRDNLKKGRIGERAAAEYLVKKGYKIVEVNYRTRFGEIDIVARKTEGSEPSIIFVEVKTKTGEDFGEPWEMVDSRKLGQVNRMAQMYLIKKKLGERLCRIDVIGVWLDELLKVTNLEHWENVGG
ncbi:MAG: YraN family protein [Candidatus Beckwithbacteria bacterium]